MKQCPSCGSQWNDQFVFCGKCGAPLPLTQTPLQNTPSGTPQIVQPISSPTGVPASPQIIPPVSPAAPQNKPKRFPAQKMDKKKTLLLALGISLGAVALIVILGLLTNWFGLVSPIQGLINAGSRTFTAKSMTINYTAKTSYDDYERTEEGELRILVDREEREISYLQERSYRNNEGDSSRNTQYFHNGESYYYTEYSDGDSWAGSSENDDFEDEFFDEAEDIINDKNEINWKKLLRKAGLEDYVEHDEVEPFLRTLYKEYLCSGKWLKETAGFTRKGNVYTFRPDIQDLGKDLIELCDDSDAFSREAKRNIERYIEDLIESAEDADLELELSFTVKGGKLVQIDVLAETEDMDYELQLEFSDIGKTEISEDDVDDLKRDVREWEEEHTCSDCGEYVYDWDSHGDCRYCGEHTDWLYGDGYCWDCYYYGGYCYKCGEYSDYLYSSRYCYDCYWD